MIFSQSSQKHGDFISDYGRKDELSPNERQPEMTWIPTEIEAFFFFNQWQETFLLNVWIVPCPRRSGGTRLLENVKFFM